MTFNVQPGEEVEITVYTRSLTGAKCSVMDAYNPGKVWVSDVVVKHNNTDHDKLPSHVCLTKNRIKGPASIKVKGESLGSRFVASASSYMVAFSVH